MHLIFWALAAAGIVYFIVIVAYSGITASFCWIWLLFAAVFVLMGFFALRARKNRGGMPKRLPTFLCTTFAIGAVVTAVLMTMVIRTANADEQPGSRYVIVLGAKVYPDGISRSLKFRLDKAFEYWRENPEATLILSGGQGEDEIMPEAMAMYNYLHIRGVPGNRMIMEMQSLSTFENIAYSRLIIDSIDGPEAHTWVTTGIVSNNYHLFRALSIARKQGFQNIGGIAAPSDRLLFVHQCVRECAAILKDALFGNFGWEDAETEKLFRDFGFERRIIIPKPGRQGGRP